MEQRSNIGTQSNFQASRGWLHRFFIRNSLSLRARTSTEQIITASGVKTVVQSSLGQLIFSCVLTIQGVEIRGI